MTKFIRLVKKCMIDKGRDDFTNYLAEIIGKSKQCASGKLNGSIGFSADDVTKLNKELDFDAEELKEAIKC